jgi:hypothetical protein
MVQSIEGNFDHAFGVVAHTILPKLVVIMPLYGV